MIKKFTLFFCTALLALVGCNKNESEAELSVSPSNPISFTYRAIESFEITVTTNQSSWDAVSDKTWCKIAKSGNKFIVTADPNTELIAPEPAKITVTAGSAEPVIIDATQDVINIYVAGSENNLAMLWKNGVSIPLEHDLDRSEARSVFVSGDDVYVAGIAQNTGLNPKARLWKNGKLVALEGTGASETNRTGAYSVCVMGNDVYTAGIDDVFACIWKNGKLTRLSEKSSAAYSLFPDGNNLYAAGFFDGNHACTWKNGQITPLPKNNDIDSKASAANSIFVSGNDVYAAGYYMDESGVEYACVWKNEKQEVLEQGTIKADAKSVFVYEGDVYVAGYERASNGREYSRLWKNGVIDTEISNKRNAHLESVFIHHGDIYLANHEYTSSVSLAVLMKNGNHIFTSPDINAAAFSLFVK